MITKGTGGGNTITGLEFERKTNILDVLAKQKGYDIRKNKIYFQEKEVAVSLTKNALYRFLKEEKVNYEKILSKKLLPDEAIYVYENKTLFVIEMKFQKTAGSVDEKLQTCDFKKKQYKKLIAPLNLNVEYIYILDNWFKNPRYQDVLDYIISVGCKYYFQYLPLELLELPKPVVDN